MATYNETFSSGIGVSSTHKDNAVFRSTVSASLAVSGAVVVSGMTMSGALPARITVADGVSAAVIYHALISAVIRAGSFVPASLSDVDGQAVWVVDLGSQSSMSYENYGFNSFAKIGGKYYGARPEGLYLLEGGTDDGDPITASVDFGAFDFDTPQHKAVPNAYLGVSSDGRLWMRVQVDGGPEYLYQARTTGEAAETQRFDFGRGLKGSYYKFTLYNDQGSDFEVDSVDLLVNILPRRI